MSDEEERRSDFMLAYDRESLFYRDRTKANVFKRIGDGRMYVYELDKDASKFAANVLAECLGLIKRVDRLIARLPSPRPSGFRVRLMSGTVLKETYIDGEQDWIGYVPNTCHKFLSVSPEMPCLVHESFKELIRSREIKYHGFAFEILKGDRRCPDGVDREDVDALWSVNFLRSASVVPRPK